jgi:Domain of unknown function (DUF4157)/Bacterial SH3 domain/HNH/Endo VII superfamily toxin with a SHH signature
MGYERWFRGQHDGQGRPFDWLTLARQHGIPEKLARALYEQAAQQAQAQRAAHGREQELYLELLADARTNAWRPSPGKVTRTMRLEAERTGRTRRTSHVSPTTGQRIAPGKVTLTSYLSLRARSEPAAEESTERTESLPFRAEMEAAFDEDFSALRISLGSADVPAGADAAATDEHVRFRSARPDRRLIAHELAHVVQYRRHPAGGARAAVSRPADPAEREAERVSLAVAVGARAQIREAPSAAMHLHGEEAAAAEGIPVHRVGVVNSPYVNLRAERSTDSEILKPLPFNTRVQVIRAYPGDWYSISTETGDMGYVARSYVSTNLPEPTARLHRVEGGERGYAINIARQHYGADQNIGWGQDLRFYVNVLAHVNGITVPDTADGWRTVGFTAGTAIWVPGVQFARGLRGVVNSGSPSFEAADTVGIADPLAQLDRKIRDYRIAIERSQRYMLASMSAHALQALGDALESLVWMIVFSVGLLAVTTALGALVGSLAGGVGAAPGALVGFEVGMFILKWMGLGFMLAWLASKMDRIAAAFGRFLATVWNADGGDAVLEQGGIEFAEAVGTLVGTLVEGLVLFIGAWGLGQALGAIRGTLFHRVVGEPALLRLQPQRTPPPEQMQQQGQILETRFNPETGAYEVIPPARPVLPSGGQGTGTGTALVPYRGPGNGNALAPQGGQGTGNTLAPQGTGTALVPQGGQGAPPAALVAYARSRGARTLYLNFERRLVFVRQDGMLVVEHTIIPYNQRAPYGTRSFFQAHHGIQNDWGKSALNAWLQRSIGQRLYSEGQAPTIMLRDSRSDTPHGIISNRQAGRSGTIASRTYADERRLMLQDLRLADVPDGTINSFLAQSDAYFAELYQQALTELTTRGMSREDAVTKLREIFGDWAP